MKFLCLAFLVRALSAQVVEGTVLNSVTGLGIQSVEVQLQQNNKPVFKTLTDPQGAYRFDAVPTGDYSLDFKRSAFRQPDFSSPARHSFHVAEAVAPLRFDVKMVPLAIVSGRVLAADNPLPHADVTLLATGAFVGATIATDATGRFAFEDIDPGVYTLSARAPSETPPPKADDNSRLAWIRTYFPSVEQRSAATKIAVLPGAELFGQDIRLRAVPTHRVRGRVFAPSGEPVPHISIKVVPGNELPSKDIETIVHSGDDGVFEFPALHDGVWRITAELDWAGAKLTTATRVDMSGGDVDRVELRLHPPFSLTGKIVLDAPDSVPRPRAPITVMLGPRGGGVVVHTAVADAAGNFRFDGVSEGAYVVYPSPVSAYYLASVRMGSREILGEYVDLLPGTQPLVVTYKADGGTVRGSVDDCNSATVVIAPQEPMLQSPQFVRSARCQTGGRFEISGVRPGDYYAFAFDEPPGSQEFPLFSDPAYTMRAVRVTVRPGDVVSITLKVTAK